MAVIGSNLKIQNELSLEKVAGDGITVDVGHAQIAEIGYTGADVSTNIAAVSDIADPTDGADDWTDLVSLSGGPMIVGFETHSTNFNHAAICIDENEGAGEDIRLQVVIDGKVVADMTVTKDVAAVSNYLNFPFNGAKYQGAGMILYSLIECNTSFVIRAAQEGNNFADAGTYVYVGAIKYSLLD